MAWRGDSFVLRTALHTSFRLPVLELGLHVDDYLYLVPAMIFSVLAFLCTSLYTLRHILLWWRYRRGGGESPTLPRLSIRDLPKIVPVAALMVMERALYRYAYQFALGLELNILRVISPLFIAYRRQLYLSCISFTHSAPPQDLMHLLPSLDCLLGS